MNEVTPKNPVIEDCLKSMLTPYVVYRMQRMEQDANQSGEAAAAEVLKILNSNTRNPYIIWDNSTRYVVHKYLLSGSPI